MRWVFGLLFCAGVIGLLAMMRPFASEAAEPDLQIFVEQLAGADMRVSYEWRRPQRELIFRSVSGGYRERRWQVETEGFELRRGASEDFIIRTDGKRFGRVTLIAKPDLIRLPKEYQPIAAYGEGGALIYTGHFWPVVKSGTRVNTTFSFQPRSGGAATAFGDHVSGFADWRSPMAHPAFVYMGPLTPVTTAHVSALIDPAAPEWVKQEFHDISAEAFDHFAEVFGGGPDAKPNLFLTAPLGSDPGRLSFAGDALPGQFQVTLVGGAWREQSDKAVDIFRQSMIHEAFHLWQSAHAQPGDEDTAAWIHEGGADAVAAETMVALGHWDASALHRFSERARRECVEGIEDGPLAAAHARGDFRALYGCGVVIAEAIARADGTTTTDFWRDFMAAVRAGDGYSADFFYDFVSERTDSRRFSEDIQYFVETPLASPERDINRLMNAAQAQSPLARGQRR